MSTAFRAPPPDAGRRALDATRRWRLFAITAWTGFLGASLTLLLIVAVLPQDATLELDLGDFSVMFLCAWLLAMIAIALALMLALPLRRHGR